MRCESPYRQGAAEFGCMRCLPCRINQRRLWSTRLALEAVLHPAAVFLTLTISEEYVASSEREQEMGPAWLDHRSVYVREAQLFLKRLRYYFEGIALRYLIVGEYGGLTWRPHYHAVLFGSEHLRLQREPYLRAWPHGHVQVGFAEPGAMEYVTGYATKGLTRQHARLGGRNPEFVRRSLRPGLGAEALGEIAKWCSSKAGAKFIAETGDVPRSIRLGGRVVPLGRYLVGKLRNLVGIDPGDLGERYSAQCYVEVLEQGREKRESLRRQSGRQARSRLQIQTSVRGL